MTFTEGQSLKRKMKMQRRFVRTLDPLGRMVPPQEFRNEMRWKSGTELSVIKAGIDFLPDAC